MGKLGGGELNVSSDIDLVFVYPDDGETDGPRPLANQRILRPARPARDRRAGRAHPDGFVFRVDMRLRPYGDSGPLTVSFAALEQYLVTQGRAWERYAWLKARPLTGARHDELAGARHAVRVSQVPRLRCLRGPARHPSPDPRAGRRRDYALEHQARSRRHPRDRVHRAGAAARSRRPRAGAARARHAAGARCARRARPAAGGGGGGRCATPTCSCATSSTGCSIATIAQTQTLPGRRRRARRAGGGDGLPASRRISSAALAAHRQAVAAQFDAAVRRRRRRRRR